jgi:cobalt-zinc-cadmium efflux system membrane fusion protein
LVSPDLGSAFSDELKAKADLIQAEHEVKRQRELYAVRASAQKDLEQAEGNFAKARAEYQRAQQKTRLLQQGQSDSVSQEFVLRSPIDGEVIARSANPGVEVQGAYSGSGNVVELFTIGSIEDLWLMGDVYETDLPYVKRGAEVDLTVSIYPGRTFLGRVDWISDTVDPVLRTAKVRCVLKNQKGLLRPEMYEVVNVAAPPRHALTIPRDALLRLGDETDVFVEMPQDKDGRIPFRRKRVIANEQFPGKTVPVLAGLQPGERVAASGSIFLIGN